MRKRIRVAGGSRRRPASPGASGLAWGLVGPTAIIWIAAIVVALPRTTNQLDVGDMLWGLSFLALSVIGGIVVSRRRRDLFGWLLIVSPLLLGIGVLADDYVGRIREGAPWPGAPWAGLVGYVCFAAALAGLAFAMYRFPNGQPVAPIWRLAETLTAVAAVAGVLAALLAPWVDEGQTLANPLFGDRASTITSSLAFSGWLLFVGGLLSFCSLFDRYRRSGPVVRAQLRWVVYPVVLGVTATGVVWLLDLTGALRADDTAGIITTICFSLGIPAGILAAITKAQLYEIDRLIRRTVSYAVITAILAGVYALVAVAPGALFDLDSDLLVAAATLAAVAALGPVRRRVQAAVDHRFDRTRYDARRVVAQFTGRLRDEVDLDDLRADFLTTVAAAVRPTSVQLWLRTPGERDRVRVLDQS
ncbi:MAG: hypothetical protein ACR2MA_12595 [Egibacteraceae bacterium]